jgi:hypothetical protein
MTPSVTTKRAVIINAIAITTALALISGYSPLQRLPLNQMQSLMPSGTLFHP